MAYTNILYICSVKTTSMSAPFLLTLGYIAGIILTALFIANEGYRAGSVDFWVGLSAALCWPAFWFMFLCYRK